MQLLTIDTRNNCYVINPNDMNALQDNVATSLTLENGTFDIQISGGTYSYNTNESAGEPLVLLWIYGVDGNTFTNKNTGITVGTTWTTLNGYSDRLQLEVPNQAVLCALFFDIHPGDNSGAINLLVTSSKAGYTPKTLTVDSQKNCYSLSASYLNSLKQWGSNFIEVDPGNYRLKIQSSNASYWSESKKFQLEPWALLWMKSGKFTPQLTGTEVKETWCSLNGVNDEFVFSVAAKTTIAGFFFDTFKDDNEGQIVLALEPVTAIAAPPAVPHPDYAPDPTPGPGVIVGRAPGSDGDGITSDRRVVYERRETQIIGERREWRRESQEVSFKFEFDDSNFDSAWKKIAAKVESAVTVTGQDSSVDAQRWDQLENWLMMGYKTQAKELAIKVARLELMLNTFKQQLEGNLKVTFSRWSNNFDGQLQTFIGTQVIEVTNASLTAAIAQLKALILDRVRQLIQVNLSATKVEIDTRAKAQISTVTADFDQRLAEQITRLQSEMNQAIDTQISTLTTESRQQLSTRVYSLRDELTQNINTRITNIQVDVEKTLNVTEVVSEEVSREIKTSVLTAIDSRFSDIQTRIRQLEQDIDTKIERLRVDFRGEIITAILDQINALIEQKIKLEMTKVDFNTYIVQIDARANKYIDQIKQLEVTLISRIDQGDRSLYNWTLEQLMAIKGCMADREVLVEQLALLSTELQTRLDSAPCVNPTVFKEWKPLPAEAEPKALPGSVAL